MTYYGAIGSVNVLEFMSNDLFDEAQENPFLLTPTASTHSPAFRPTTTGAVGAGKFGVSSPGSSSAGHRSSKTSAKQFELPLQDPQEAHLQQYHLQQHDHALPYPQTMLQLHHAVSQPPPSPLTPASTPSSPKSRASVTFNLPKSILKRHSSYESDASTVPSDSAEATEAGVDVNEMELRKLLYSLARFSVASEASGASSPEYEQQRQREYSISQPASPNSASSNTNSYWPRDNRQSHESPPCSPASAGEIRDYRYMQQCQSTGRATLKSRQSRKKNQRSKSADRIGYNTDPGEDDGDDGYGDDCFGDSAVRSRGSVNFQTVKHLLRGGGSGGRTSRFVKRTVSNYQPKSAGTVSSRLKVRQKFARPTILTDANHRVSTMKLGTKPMPAKVKHLAFLESFDPEALERDVDAGMPSPKGQLRAASLVMFDTLDKIGTRAACPVHLIAEETPDYTNIPPRVDSHNHLALVRQGLRRPSAWLTS